jgi:Arc/MetJ family transcription regulator
MRTNIDIDDDLMAQAMRVSGLTTKRETVEAGLRLLIKLEAQQRIRRYRGKLRWEGNLDRMRRDT